MSIKEALERVGSMSREAPSLAGSDWQSGDSYYENHYTQILLEKGRAILEEAKASALFKELADIIRPDFSDVKIEQATLTDGGTVSLGIEWNFRDELAIPGLKYIYNVVDIVAYPLTSDLVVSGGEEFGVLNKSQWSSDPKLLEDAIVRAYHKPMQVVGSLRDYNN